MRKNLFLFVLVAILLFACKKFEETSTKEPVAILAKEQVEETPYYYYYKGSKKHLHLNTEYFFVSFRNNTDSSLSANNNVVKTCESEKICQPK